MTGQEYNLIYPVVSEDGLLSGDYEPSDPLTFQRMVNIEKTPLPPGNYELEYVLYDVFIRQVRLERVKMTWDGTGMHITDSSWEGDITMDISSYYEKNSKNISIQDVEELSTE